MLVNEFKRLLQVDNGFVVVADNARFKLYFVSDDIVRVRCHFDARGTDYSTWSQEQLWSQDMPERSYALVTTAWEDELDELFKDERTRVAGVMPQVSGADDAFHEVVFETASIKLHLSKKPFGFALEDKATGEIVY